ncbi:MAG: VanZ family protein [Alphaproteobacteria bacterium]|uniref:VanZ family protein n=1 Tax=Candidatus Nitrobium versatile TaxID=2884831 RepID=A0A953J424_9BACT|nr:VanZ family protein [Candidatus Nitrobium versatile]
MNSGTDGKILPWIGRWAFYAVLVAVFVLSLTPESALPDEFSISDVVNHFAAFLVLSFLFDGAYPRVRPAVKISALVAFGALIEVLQGVLPYRTCSVKDLAVDCLAVVVYRCVRR